MRFEMKFGLLIFFAAGTLAAPFLSLDDDLPRTEVKDVGCSSTRFRQGQTFTYDYAGETIHNVEGSSKHETGLLLRARIIITPLSECNFRMQLDSAELRSKTTKQEIFHVNADSAKFKKEIEQNELLFAMRGNKITKLQVHSSEPTHILNIKRGILSTLQIDESSKTEIDVHGECETTVEVENGKIVKTKKLSECSNRAQNEIGIQTGSIKTESSLKPLDSNSRCQYKMDGELIQSVACEETHLFKPFSAGYRSPAGAMTTVKQQITLVKSKNSPKAKLVAFEDLGAETTLVFDHTNEELKSSKFVTNQVEQIMNRLVDQTKLSAKQDSAHEFSSLVFLLRKMDEKRMKAVWDKYFDCISSETCGRNDVDVRDVYRQYLLDAVAYCGTSTCISMVHDVILSGDVSGERMNMFLQSIALVAKTTTNMIRDVLNIARKQPSRQAFLTLGTLMARHCAKFDCKYDTKSPITQAEEFLKKLLGNNCENQGDHERVEEILMALKAIGNAKRPSRAFKTILHCAKKAIHANITRAAFDAVRGFTCAAERVDDLLNIVKEHNMDPEKRIHAFIAMMKCPSEKHIKHVMHMLENEQTKQVASFVWSSFTNIMESSDPKNTVAKEILTRLTKSKPLKNFDLPFHHFSRAYEKSFHLDSIDSGATAEGHIIFHPDGYLPRSAMMNITANVMGVPVNVIEAMVGMDGIEAVLENVFGPNGVMPDNVILNLFNFTFTSEKFKELAERRENNKRRTRRAAVEDKIEELHKRVNKVTPKPSGHVSFKIMGQEIRVMSYDDIFWMIDQIDNMNVIQLLLNVAKGGHKTFSKSAMFLEMTHTVPTGLGLPLKLKLVGSTVATVELDGKFDIRNMFWGPGSLQINGYVKPSAVIELSGQMGVDSHYVSTGLFVNSSMFVSNMMKGRLDYKEGQKLQINMDTPEEPIQLFNFSSTPFMYMNNEVDLIEGVERKINPDFCMKSEILGYGLCTSLRLPVAFRNYEAPYFPLSGPAHFGMKLIRGDENLKTFQFLVTMTKKQYITKGTIEFSTPGAKYERQLGGEMMYSDFDNTKSLVLSTERYGKEASIEFNYNTITHRAEIQTKSNFFTSKDVITKLVYFNKTHLVSQQYGILLSAEYDWYKFEHVTRYVRKSTGHMLHSSTLYYPKKTVTGVLEYNSQERKMSARFDSEQFKQAVEVSGKWEKDGEEKGLTLTATHLTSGKFASVYGGIVNTDNKKELITSVTVMGKTAKNVLGCYNRNGIKSIENLFAVNGKTAKFEARLENKNAVRTLTVLGDVMGKKGSVVFEMTNKIIVKSLRMKVEAAEKTAEITMGYYKIFSKKVVKIEGDIMGRKGVVFAIYLDGKVTVGGQFGIYIGGVEGVYTNNHGHGQTVCSKLYYGTESSPKSPITACANYHSVGKSYVHNKLTFSMELNEMNKKGELFFDFQKHTGHIKMKSELKYNGKVYAKNTYNLRYRNMMNSELKMDVEVGKYTAGYKWFTKQDGMKSDVGLEAYVMDKTILFLNQYETSNVDGTKEMHLVSQVDVNGKTFPVTTKVSFVHGNGVSGPTFRLNVGKYAFVYSKMATYSAAKYGWNSEFMAMKEQDVLFKLFEATKLSYSSKVKELTQKFGVFVAGRTYEYGWEAAYQNLGTVSKTGHQVTLRLQYATKRMSTISFTFADSKNFAEMLVNFEYIPTKKVSHFIRYTKENRQLDISIEFLPQMFTKFMARLDKNNGYSLTTDMSIEWDNFKRSMEIVNGYKNNKKIVELSTTIGKDLFSFVTTYMKTNPKAVQLSATILKRNIKLVAIYTKRNVQLRGVYNRQMLFNIVADYDKKNNVATFSLSNGKKTLFKVSGDFDKSTQMFTMSVVGQGEWIKMTGQYDEYKKEIISAFSVLEKEYFKAIGKYAQNAVSLKLVATQLKREITFAGQINKETKEVTISAETAGKKAGIIMRADWINFIMGVSGFVNKHTFGWEVSVKDTTLIYKIILTPTVSGQVVFEIKDDRILRMTVQRQTGDKAITETSFQYKLSKNMCQFALRWNTDTIKKITDLIKPLVDSVVDDVSKFSKKVVKISKEFITESADDAGKAALNFLSKIDKSFDEIDFIAARDKVGQLTIKALRKLSALIKRSLKQMARGLDHIKENLPKWVHKSRQMASKAKELMATMKVDAVKNLKEINVILTKVIKNLTESTRPIVNKAITLIKDFKIRGKPLKELVVIAKAYGQKYLDIYTKEAKVQWVILKTKSIELYNMGTTYILAVKIPYRKETVKDVLEIVTKKVNELKQKISDTDVKKMLDEFQVTVMEYKLQGKPIKKHLVILTKDLKNLPQKTKEAILKLIQTIRLYAKNVDKAMRKVIVFSKPLMRHVKFVAKSVSNHFGPLCDKSMKNIRNKLNKIELPSIRPYFTKKWQIIEEFFLPLLTPIRPLYNNLRKQIRNLKVMGFTVGPLADLQMSMINDAVEKYMKRSTEMMNEQMEKFNNYVEIVSKMTPEEMVEKTFTASSDVSDNLIKYATKMYKQREVMMKKSMEQIKTLYKKMNEQYTKMVSQSFEEVMDRFIHATSERITNTAEELSDLIKEVASLNIAGPTWKAWKQANVLGHLRKYGVNRKMIDFTKAAKDIDLQKLVLDTIKAIKQYTSDVYSQMFIRAIQSYGKFEKVRDYIRSIPKKEYEEWYNELKDFTLDNKDNIVKFMTKVYKITEKRTQKMYISMKKASKVNYNAYYKDYVKPAKQLCGLVAAKLQLVYDDIKQPTIDVAAHYNRIVSEFIKEQYKIVYERALKEYKKVYNQMKYKVNEFTKMMEKEYEKFLNKYGDLTWEEITDNACKYTKKQSLVIKDRVLKEYKKLEQQAKKLQAKAKKLYKKVIAEYKKQVKYLKTEIKPKMMKTYKTYSKIAKQKARQCMNKCKKLFVKARKSVMDLYEKNKDKTLKTIYIEIKTIIVKQFKKQCAIVVAFVNKNKAELKTLAVKYYTKADVLMRTVILPELKKESESLINQTLHASVVMANETVKAYYPHFVLVKDFVSKYANTLKSQAIVAFEKSKVSIKTNMDKIIKMLTEFLQKLKSHELYKKSINHEYVVKATKKIQELIKITKQKVKELKSHPTTVEYRKKAEIKIAELKKQIAEYRTKLESYYKHPKVVAALKTLKQIKTSGLFTYNKLSERMSLYNDAATITLEIMTKMFRIAASEAAVDFRRNPEETFWKAVEGMKEMGKATYDVVNKFNKDTLMKKSKSYYSTFLKLSKNMINECTDDWTKETAKTLYRDSVAFVKKVETKVKELPEKIKTTLTTSYKAYTEKFTKFYKEQYNKLKAHWKTCPCRAFFVNPLWKEIADEVMNHELVEAAKTIAIMAKEKFIELKVIAIKELKSRKAIFEQKLNELKSKVIDKYNDMKIRSIKQYKQLVKRYKELIKTVEEFVDTTTIADIVKFVEKTYDQTIEKIKATKAKLIVLKTKYTAKVKALYAKYEKKATEMYTKIYAKADALYIKYKGKMMPVYKKYEAKVKKVWNKYYPIVVEKYEKLYQQTEKKYEEISKQLEELYMKYKKETIEFLKKTKQETYNKWVKTVNAKFNVFKKMTIKETIEVLKKLPKQTKMLVSKTYNEYYKLAVTKMNKQYKKTLKELEVQREKLIATMKPYTVPTLEAFKWVQNEVTETAIFVYNYYKIAEQCNDARNYVTKEYERIAPLVKAKAEIYAKEYTRLAKVYAKKGVVYAKDAAAKAGHNTLRGIHSTMKYVDNIDVNQMKQQARSYYTEILKYVTFDVTNGEILVTFYHRDITPSFSHHVNKVGNTATRTIRSLKLQGNELLEKANVELKKLKIKAQNLRDQIQKQIMENTVEIRSDLQRSYAVNKKIAQRVYFNTKLFAQKTYKRAMIQYKVMKFRTTQLAQKAKVLAKEYYEKFMAMSQKAYLKAGDMFWDMYTIGTYKSFQNIRSYTIKYWNIARRQSMSMYRKYKPIVKKEARKQLDYLKTQARQLKKDVQPFYQDMKTAFIKWRSGVPSNKSFYPIYRQMNFAANYYQDKVSDNFQAMKRKLCKSDPKLCKYVREASNVHNELFDKYATRVVDLYTFGKVHLHKVMRKTMHCIRSRNSIKSVKYNDVAMIFGRNHILTFDNKFYNFIDFKRPECTYMLAHDFADHQFSIMSQQKAIIIKTPEMEIKISSNGKTKATIGETKSFMLPVETESNKCIRMSSLIICHFMDQKFKVVVDLKHFVSTISLSAWHFGKTQGLLGTNNREAYDDWKLPNGEFANNVYQLANTYEVSGNKLCQITPRKIKSCSKTRSKRCDDIFKSSTSPFAKYFKTVNPEAFYEACKQDTAACGRRESLKTTYCNTAAAYVSMARAKGQWISYLKECMAIGPHAVDDKWNQKPLKNAVDVVVMVSQRSNVKSSKKEIASVMFHLQRTLRRSNQKTRFALIGFGGEGLNEKAHVLPLGVGANVFGNVIQLIKNMKAMPYTGRKSSNDAYHAILLGSRLRFRAGASKVFILFNTEPHSSHEFGPTFDHTMYDLQHKANASLYIFDKFSFKHLSQDHGQVIGQSARKLYTDKRIRGTPSASLRLPANEFYVMAHNTDGAVFSSIIKNPKAVATSLSDAISYGLRRESQLCKSCQVHASWTGTPKAVCQSRNDITC